MPADTGTIVFVHKHEAPLAAGEYAITVTQDVSNRDCKDPKAPAYISEHPSRTRRFAVLGPRLSLAPDDLNALFPPQGNRGEYQNCLPHVVLTGRTLPWLRPCDEQDLDIPWLAVLLFEESEAPEIKPMRMQDLKAGAAAGVASYGDAFALAGGTFQPDYGQDWSDPCRVIDVPAGLFGDIAPKRADAKLLAHARAVDPRAKAGQPQTAPVDLVVVIGNRLPAPNTRCTAHLVSIEMMAAFLPGGSTGPQTSDGRPANAVRLVSLAAWSFTSVDPKETFAQYLESAQPAPLRRAVIPDAGDAAAYVKNALDMGYSALAHQTRLGDGTVSWYRGPFAPYGVSGRIAVPLPNPDADPPVEGPQSADSLVRYDPDHQMFDVSYAAAWEIGRLLALQDRSFSVTLCNWRRSLALKTAAAIERRCLDDLIGNTSGPAGALHAAAAVVRATFGNGTESPAHTGTPRRPLFTRATVFATITAAISDVARLANLHEDTPVPAAITDWLGRLRLFHGVPFHYLVPDEAMLPPERIRFFEVDPNWTISLIEGALSIGRSTSSDAAHDLALSPKVQAASLTAARTLRNPRVSQETTPKIWSGFLLRSAVVSGWPGLEVYAIDAGGAPLTPLRMERLAPDLLLFIADGVAAQIRIQEPSEALHFGLDLAEDGVTLSKSLRYINKVGANEPGDPILDVANVDIAWRSRDLRVIDMIGLRTNILARMPEGAAPAEAGFTSAEFALEMVEGVQAVVFKVS